MHSTRTFTATGRTILGLSLAAFGVGCSDSPTAPPPDVALSTADAPQHPVRLDFNKCLVDPAGVWEGEVTGDVGGDLRTELTGLRIAGAIWHVRFDWVIDADDRSFVAALEGTLNTRTGAVVMNGRVIDGYLHGAQVHEQGQLVDAASSCFAGTIRIMPATASQAP